ncbi:MAG: helix-turn-helix transcriptional regulator [Clostridiales bacterium]|nr:helix-turn-helix transcriptional regulator [Clostridiales bacterium]
MEYRYSREMHVRFYNIRKALGLTQKETGEALGITAGYYSKLESVEKPVKKNVIISICNVFDVRFEYLVYGEDPMFHLDDQRKRRLVELFNEIDEPCKDYMVGFLEYYQKNRDHI